MKRFIFRLKEIISDHIPHLICGIGSFLIWKSWNVTIFVFIWTTLHGNIDNISQYFGKAYKKEICEYNIEGLTEMMIRMTLWLSLGIGAFFIWKNEFYSLYALMFSVPVLSDRIGSSHGRSNKPSLSSKQTAYLDD